jgi:hypothetical protein
MSTIRQMIFAILIQLALGALLSVLPNKKRAEIRNAALFKNRQDVTNGENN